MSMRAVPFRIPLRTRFRGVDRREGVLVEGPCGWGEFSPFPDYSPQIASVWLAAAREAADTPWPPPRRDRIPVNVTVPAVDPETAYELVARSGCSTAKVKVAEPGQTAPDDRERVAAVRDAVGSRGSVRVDANGAWDVDEAAARLAVLARFGLEYAEQPVATLDELEALRGRVEVPLAADESLRRLAVSPAGPSEEDLARVGAVVDVAVIKVAPLGGVWPALRVAEAVGLPAVVSSAVETSVGLAAGVALAAALPELPHACGLGTASMLVGDVVGDPLVPVEGMVEVRRPDIDADALAAWTPTGGEAGDLHDRLAAAERAAARR